MDYIVLGQIPGTNLELGFVGYMVLFDLILIFLFFKKYHPDKLTRFIKKLNLRKNLGKLYKKLSLYEKRLAKRLAHFRNNVLGPKLKFLK